MAAVSYTARNVTATWNAGAIIDWYVTAEALSQGDVVYINASNQVAKAISTSSATGAARGIVVNVPNQYAETSVPAGQQVGVCLQGTVYGFTGLVSGQVLYVSKTVAGGLDTAAPTAAYSYIFANAEDATTIFVRPGQSVSVSV